MTITTLGSHKLVKLEFPHKGEKDSLYFTIYVTDILSWFLEHLFSEPLGIVVSSAQSKISC